MQQTTHESSVRQVLPDVGQIDLIEIGEGYLRCLRQYWLQLLLVLLIIAFGFFARSNMAYHPSYTAKVTYIASKTGNADVDDYIAKRLGSAAGTIVSLPEFRSDIREALLAEDPDAPVPAYSIRAQYAQIANFFNVFVTCSYYPDANRVLRAFEEVYPEWVNRSNGTVRLSVLDRTPANGNPNVEYSGLNALLQGLLYGLAVSAVIATAFVLLGRTIKRDSDMRRITDKPCYAQVPEIQIKKRSKSRSNPLLITAKHVDWGFRQTILSAYTRVENQMQKSGARVILVTSTIPQEGKSLMASNLALASVQSGHSTVLLDGDFRNPSVMRMFGEDPRRLGLIEYFSGKAKLRDIKFMTDEGVALISSGRVKGRLSAYLSEDRMKRLMDELKQSFEVIVIDTPPAHLFADAALLSEYADSVVYVIRHDLAGWQEIRDGMSLFIREGRLSGYIINRTQGSVSGYGYRYGRYSRYGRYGKYGKYGHYGSTGRYIHLDEEEMNTEDTL